MIVLVLTVCGLAGPCEEVRLPVDMSPVQCALFAQQPAAAWADAHPGKRVARWRCAVPEREQEPT